MGQLVAIGLGAAALVIVGFLAGAFLLGGKDTGRPAAEPSATATPASSATGSVGPTALAADASPGAGAPIESRYHLYRRASGFRGVFAQAGTLTSSTSRDFMIAVADAYAASGAAGGPATLTDVYSTATGKTYVMTCTPRSDATVLCTGGRNAEVLLFD